MTTTPCYYLCSTTFKKVLLRIHIFTYARHSINLHALKHRTSEQNFGGGISSQTLKVSDMLKFSKTHGGLCRIQQARGQCKNIIAAVVQCTIYLYKVYLYTHTSTARCSCKTIARIYCCVYNRKPLCIKYNALWKLSRRSPSHILVVYFLVMKSLEKPKFIPLILFPDKSGVPGSLAVPKYLATGEEGRLTSGGGGHRNPPLLLSPREATRLYFSIFYAKRLSQRLDIAPVKKALFKKIRVYIFEQKKVL